MKKNFGLIILAMLASINVAGQTKYDTIFNYMSTTPVTIDGQATEECWTNAEWYAIGQTWIPWGVTVSKSDFEGRFKVSWDEEYFYLLVEIHDDSISDDHADPLQNYWDDDCVEIFIDEDRSMGNHQYNNNAFAYHVSTFYDAVDVSTTGGGINYKDHIDVVMDTIGDDLYLWEFAIKLHDATYNNSNPEASRVFPENGKIMGFSVAYCDNDETTSRENFFGSMTLTSATANNSYIDATIFGVMKLIDPNAVSVLGNVASRLYRIYPNPSEDYFVIDLNIQGERDLTVYSADGREVLKSIVNGGLNRIGTTSMEAGPYFIRIDENSAKSTEILMVR